MLVWLIIIPVLAAFLIGLARFPARPVSLLAAAFTLVLGVAAVVFYDACPEWWSCVGGIPLQLTLGPPLAKVMVLLSVLVTFGAVVGLKAPEGAQKSWYVSTLLISAGAAGAFLSDNIISFFAFHELALIPTFVMIGRFGRGDRRSIAWRITLYLGAASMVLLAGLLLLGAQMGFNFTQIARSAALGGELEYPFATAALLLGGFGTLISLFPFHSWAAPAYASAPAPVAMMHAGVLKKFGLYGLFMIGSALGPQIAAFSGLLNDILLVCLLGNVIWVGYVTVNQKRLDSLLGNSSVMHMGYIFLAFAAYVACGGQNEWAVRGAALLMLGHGLSIALLFLLAARIEDRTRTLEISALGGLASKLPVLGFLFGLAALASIGLPLLANFPGEIAIFFSGFWGWRPSEGILALGHVQIATIVALWGLVISAVYMLRAFRSIFEGETSRASERAAGGFCGRDLAAAGFLAFWLVFFGLCPFLIAGLFS
ncbi:MAG: hypothetical protein LIO63_01905 [Akkermansia sp.]|nr:hypothetical protein [Akkermansia sp.]